MLVTATDVVNAVARGCRSQSLQHRQSDLQIQLIIEITVSKEIIIPAPMTK